MPRENGTERYSAFISYSHDADKELAPAIRKGLQRLAKPWYRRRALRVFLDNSALGASSALGPAIEEALDRSDFFILLASPPAAQSDWVNMEVDYWRANRRKDRMLIILTEGDLVWSDHDGEFDWDVSTAAPDSQQEALPQVPGYVDMRWAQHTGQFDLRHSKFRSRIATLAAPIHGVDRDEIEGEDIRQQKRTRKTAWAAGLGLLTLAIVATIAGVLAVHNAARAEREAQLALSRQLAAQSLIYLDTQPDLSLLLSLESVNISNTVEARSSLLASLLHDPSLLTYLRDHDSSVTSSAFSPDSQLLATAAANTIIVWDPSSRDAVSVLSNPSTDFVWSLAFSPDGSTLVSGDGEGAIVRWDTSTWTRSGNPLEAHSSRIAATDFSPDGAILATAGDDGYIGLWDTVTWDQAGEPVRASTGRLNALEVSPDGKLIATSDALGAVALWDLSGDQSVGAALGVNNRLLDVTGAEILDLAFSPDGLTLALASGDADVVLLDVATLQLIGEPMERHVDAVLNVAFSPDGEILASGGLDNTLILWDVALQEMIGEPKPGHVAPIETLSFSPDGKFLASGGRDRTIVIRDIAGRAISGRHPLATTMYGHRDAVLSLAYHPAGDAIASGDAEGFVAIWNPQTRQQIRPRSLVHTGRVWDLAFDPTGEALVSAGDDGTIAAWDSYLHGDSFEVLRDHGEAVHGVAFSPSGDVFASVGASGTVLLWDADTRVVTRSYNEESLVAISDVEFSPTGATLATAGAVNGTAGVVLWDVVGDSMDGEPLQREGSPMGIVTSIAFSPDATVLAAGDSNGAIVLWDLATNEPIGDELIRHRGWITDIEFTPDGSMLVSAGVDSSLILWQTGSPQPLAVISMQERGAISSVAVDPTRETLATGGADGSIVLLDLDLGSWQALACSVANRDLTAAEFESFLGPDVSYRPTCPGRTEDGPTTTDGRDSADGGSSASTDRHPSTGEGSVFETKVYGADDILGSWQIVWDQGAPYEESSTITFTTEGLRDFDVEITEDGHVSFVDDGGCEHVGVVSVDGEFASGTYSGCDENELYAGVWEATKITDE